MDKEVVLHTFQSFILFALMVIIGALWGQDVITAAEGFLVIALLLIGSKLQTIADELEFLGKSK